MEPVHGGLLANMTEKAETLFKAAVPEKSVAPFAMRWVMALKNVQVVLSGMSDVAQACTACHYCCPDCPKKLDILKYMAEMPEMLKAFS